MAALTHPLTTDRWSVENEPEFGVVRLSQLHQLERASWAIKTIARLVGNSALEPSANNVPPLDAQTVANLMDGVETICEQLATMGETIREESSRKDDSDTFSIREPAVLYIV